MAGLSFNYSKWDNLELSDDEDPHPGAQFIEEQTLRRIKRESHQVKEIERRSQLRDLEKEAEAAEKQMRELESLSLAASGTGADEELKAKKEQAEREAAEKRAEIERLEKERTFNAEEYCQVTSEKTLIGSACATEQPWMGMSYEEYCANYSKLADKYADVNRSYDDNESFLESNPVLLHEHCMAYLLMKALHLGMENKTKAMRRVTKQKYHIKSLLDFAGTVKKDVRGAVRPFFARLRSDPEIEKDYLATYEDLMQKLLKRAAEKVEEEKARGENEYETVELSREERLGPGGLDPVEVFDELPKEIQEAYQAQDIGALKSYVDNLPLSEAKVIMRKMVDSGLWVPEPGAEGLALQDEGED